MAGPIGGKVLRLRWAATCVDCGRALAPGDRAWWFHLDDVARCMTCAEPPAPATASPPVATPPPAAEQPRPKREARSAGASAQSEYERRRSNDKVRVRENLPILVPLVLAAPVVGYVGVHIGAHVLDDQFRAVASTAVEGGVDTEPMFDAGLVNLVALVAAFTMALSAARLVLGARQSTEAWRKGAEGERLTGRALQKLPAAYRVLHDLPMPRSKANIDHVVVGPTGVFTVETKNYKGGVNIKDRRVYGGGRNLESVVRQAQRQAAAVADRTGAIVVPVVCVHGGGVAVEGLFQQPVVDGVRFCSGRRLTKIITGDHANLSGDAIAQIERQLS